MLQCRPRQLVRCMASEHGDIPPAKPQHGLSTTEFQTGGTLESVRTRQDVHNAIAAFQATEVQTRTVP